MENKIIIFATDNAKKYYREKRKNKKINCPTCEIKEIKSKNGLIELEIKKEKE